MHPTKVVGCINQKRDGRIVLGIYTLMEASMTVTTNE